jgi:hypothetical protein
LVIPGASKWIVALWLLVPCDGFASGEEKPTPGPRVSVGGLFYLSYQNGTASTGDFSRFVIKRGYINVEAKLASFLSARITPDVVQLADGDVELRLKYAYAKFSAAHDAGFIRKLEAEIGIAHTPWLDFEEHVNLYRMQDPLFPERIGLFNSADFGVTAMGLLGGVMPDDYQKSVSRHYPGRYGSFAFGVYNGGGYHANEANENKAVEGRLTIRPAPDSLPGLQVSYFGVHGKGNLASEPEWSTNVVMASYEHRRFVATATWLAAVGNQSGTAVDAEGQSLDGRGWSLFGEAKLRPSWSVIGRLDRFEPDTSAPESVQKRYIGGIAYHLGGGNELLFDYDRRELESPGTRADSRVQLTVQVSF